jgi:FMN phosphatase YigB (HAD superfamily)
MPIRAVLFDVGDTLWHAEAAPPAAEFRRMAAERAAASLTALGLRHEDPSLVARTVWLAIEDAMAAARKGDLAEPDYGDVARRALIPIGLDIPRDTAATLLESTYVSGAEGGKAAYPDAAATLAELRARGFLLATVTNRAFGGERFREDLRAAGLDASGWDSQSVSVEVGYLKPHPRLFLHALEALQIAPSEALMVGNSLREDVAGAQHLGIRAAWKRFPPDAVGVIPDYTFDELSELLEIPELKQAG